MKKTISGRKVKLVNDSNPELKKGCGGCVFDSTFGCTIKSDWDCMEAAMVHGGHYVWVDDTEELQKPN